MYQVPGLLIAGKDVKPVNTPTIDVIDPATEEVLGAVVTAGAAEIGQALDAATLGFEAWRKVAPWERSRILRRIADLMRERADDMAYLLTRETGKPLAEGKGEVLISADHFDWCADEARRLYDKSLGGRTAGSRIEISYEPVGIVLALTAWNFPINLPARKIAMALAAGCSVIVRPSEEAPASTAALVHCVQDAGVPAGAINMLIGSPEAVVAPLMAASAVRAVSFTGSTRVGQILARQSADTLKRLTMELGGHAPFLVLEDADVDKAAAAAVMGKFRNAGQVCTSPSRFFVHESLARPFAEKMAEGAKALRLGNGLDAATQMGPLTTSRQRDHAQRMVDDARQKGATILAGGGRPAGINHGYFFEPTVMTDVPEDALILSIEPFIPVAPIVSVGSTEEAIAKANSLDVGLSSFVFSRSEAHISHVASRLEAGLVGANTVAVATPEAPFGGVKQSGYGREGGEEGVREFLNPKFVHRFPG